MAQNGHPGVRFIGSEVGSRLIPRGIWAPGPLLGTPPEAQIPYIHAWTPLRRGLLGGGMAHIGPPYTYLRVRA